MVSVLAREGKVKVPITDLKHLTLPVAKALRAFLDAIAEDGGIAIVCTCLVGTRQVGVVSRGMKPEDFHAVGDLLEERVMKQPGIEEDAERN